MSKLHLSAGPFVNMSCQLLFLLNSKAKTLKASVNALLEEIKLREDLNADQFKIMNGERCRQHTDLMQLENVRDCYPGDLTRDVDEAKAKIKANVLVPRNN